MKSVNPTIVPEKAGSTASIDKKSLELLNQKVRHKVNRHEWMLALANEEDSAILKNEVPPQNIHIVTAKRSPDDSPNVEIKRVEDKKITSEFWHLMVTVCYALSLGSIVEFPMTCYRHGGVTYLVHYSVALIAVGFPMAGVELGLGQFAGLPVGSLFKALNVTYSGIGKAMLFVSFWRLIWSTQFAAYTGYIMLLGVPGIFTRSSPWTACGSEELLCTNYTLVNDGCYSCWNSSKNLTPLCKAFRKQISSSSSLYSRFTPPVLHYMKTNIYAQPFTLSELSLGATGMILTATFMWFAICYISTFGTKRLGYPLIAGKCIAFIVLIACTILVVMDEDAHEGIRLFFTFDWKHLRDATAWSSAVRHVILSLSLCDGTLHQIGAMSSFQIPFLKTAAGLVVISFIFNLMASVSFYGAISVVVSQLYFAKNYNEAIELTPRIHEYTAHGRLLTITAFPEFINSDEGYSKFLLIPIYFAAVLAIGIPVIFMNISKVTGAYEYSVLYRRAEKMWADKAKVKRICIISAISLVTFPGIFLLIQPWGTVVRDLIKHQLVNAMFVIGFVEILVVAYAYDGTRFAVDIITMHGKLPKWVTSLNLIGIYCTAPLALFIGGILHFGLAQTMRVLDYAVPNRLMAFATITLIITLGPMLLMLIQSVIRAFRENFSIGSIFRPTAYWMPPNPRDRTLARDSRFAFREHCRYSRTKTDADYDIFCRGFKAPKE